jgi:hypothetical protein
MFSVICKEQLRLIPEKGSQGHSDGETKVCNCLLCCLWVYSDMLQLSLILVGPIRLSCQHLALVYNYLPCTIKMLSTSGICMSHCKSQYNISKPGELHDLQTLIRGTEYLLDTIFYPLTYNSNIDIILNCANKLPSCLWDQSAEVWYNDYKVAALTIKKWHTMWLSLHPFTWALKYPMLHSTQAEKW